MSWKFFSIIFSKLNRSKSRKKQQKNVTGKNTETTSIQQFGETENTSFPTRTIEQNLEHLTEQNDIIQDSKENTPNNHDPQIDQTQPNKGAIWVRQLTDSEVHFDCQQSKFKQTIVSYKLGLCSRDSLKTTQITKALTLLGR